MPLKGTTTRKLQALAKEYELDDSIFKKKRGIWNVKYQKVILNCPVCNKEFETQEGHPKAKTTCSYACSNTHFRSKTDNGQYKHGKKSAYDMKNYRVKAFRLLENKCNHCGFDAYKEVLHVHHKDRNRDNNDISNLEILCPTCHEVEHFKSNDAKWGCKG